MDEFKPFTGGKMSWCFLCRKHFEQEKKVRELGYCGVDKGDVKCKCDYEDCSNKAYREVYYEKSEECNGNKK